MRGLRFLFAGLVGVVVCLSPAAFLSGCGDDANTTGTQAKESDEAKASRKKTEDAMRENMMKKAGAKGGSKAAK